MADTAISPAEIRETLERILLHAEFVAAPRLTAFLRFVVDETLEGRASRVKAYTIATTVFGRGESFDPQTNPVVRVEAMRLRQILSHYYETTGASETVEIRMGRGSYVPEFIRKSPSAPFASAPIAPPPMAPSSGRPGMAKAAAALALLFLVIAAGWLVRPQPRPAANIAADDPARSMEAPTIAVEALSTGGEPELQAFAQFLGRQLETALSRFEYPVVVQKPAAPANYQLTASLHSAGADTVSLDVRIIHVASSSILWAHEIRSIETRKPNGGLEQLSGEIAASVAQTYGVIFSDMRKRVGKLSPNARGYDCVLAAAGAMASPDDAPRGEASRCLARTLGENPDFAPAHTAAAFLGVTRYLDGSSEAGARATLDQAMEHARKAVELAPQTARAHAALFWTRFFSGRYDDAFESAQTALELNPFAAETRARIGAAHMLRGRFEQGAALIRQAASGSRWSPGWQEFFRFLEARQLGDDKRAARHALRKNALASPLGHVARIIVLAKSDDEAATREAWGEFEARFAVFAMDPRVGFDRLQMTPDLRDGLLKELAATPRPAPRGEAAVAKP